MEVGGGLPLILPEHSIPGKDPVLNVREAWWAPRSTWLGAENLTHTGIQSPDNPARSVSHRKTVFKFVILQMHSRACRAQSAVREELKVRRVHRGLH